MSSRKRKFVSSAPPAAAAAAATTTAVIRTGEKTRQNNKEEEEEEELSHGYAQTNRPSRNRRKSVKLAEAERSIPPTPPTEPQRLGVISLHHKKGGGRRNAQDSWTITSPASSTSSLSSSSSSSRKMVDSGSKEMEEEGQLLHVVTKGKRPQTIKIKPLHKPESAVPTSQRAKKLRQGTTPSRSDHRRASVAVKEKSGIKLKLILSPKEKRKNFQDVDDKIRDTMKKEPKGRADEVKSKMVSDEEGTKGGGKYLKGKRCESEKVTGNSEKGNKKRKNSIPEKSPEIISQKIAEKISPSLKIIAKTDKVVNVTKRKSTGKEEARTTQKHLEKDQQKQESKTKAKTVSVECSAANDDTTVSSSIVEKGDLDLPGNPVTDLVIDESKKADTVSKIKPKMDRKKKKTPDDSHKLHKHRSKDPKKQKPKFITTGTKQPASRNVGLDPVTASHMFGQFDSRPLTQSLNSSLAMPSPSAELNDERFFMAGSDIGASSFPSGVALLEPTGKASGKGKKSSKKSSRKSDKDRKKKRKKDKLKKGKGGIIKREKKPLSAYMLWCAQTRRKVVAQNPGLDFSGISRMMGTLWQNLPEKEKHAWQSIQRKQSIKHKNLPSLSKQKLRHSNATSGRGSRSPKGSSPCKQSYPKTEPIDCAAHLKLIGESLNLVGDRLQNHMGNVKIHGSLSVLLDSTLCIMSPLIALTSQVPQLDCIPTSTLSTTLDNIAYIMPGLG